MVTMDTEGDKLRVLDCSTKLGAGPDPALEFTKNRIKGAKFLDLTLVRDLNQPYPFMMPSQDWFIKMMKAMNVSKAHTVVVYETG